MDYKFGSIIEKSGRSFGVFFPDLPGCVSAGTTIDEAKQHAVEALTLHLEGMLQDGDEIPTATPLDELVADPDVKEVERVLVAAKIPDGADSGGFGEALLEGLDEALRHLRGEQTGAREHVIMVDTRMTPCEERLPESKAPSSTSRQSSRGAAGRKSTVGCRRQRKSRASFTRYGPSRPAARSSAFNQ